MSISSIVLIQLEQGEDPLPVLQDDVQKMHMLFLEKALKHAKILLAKQESGAAFVVVHDMVNGYIRKHIGLEDDADLTVTVGEIVGDVAQFMLRFIDRMIQFEQHELAARLHQLIFCVVCAKNPRTVHLLNQA